MAAADYKTLVDAVKTALQGTVGDRPFPSLGSVLFWPDEELDDIQPSELLRQALTAPYPIVLLSFAPGSHDRFAGGGNSHDESVGITVRYGCGSPGDDYYNALTANGTGGYWGQFAVHDWITDKLLRLDVAKFNCPLHLVSAGPIPLGQPGRLAGVLRFTVAYLRVISD